MRCWMAQLLVVSVANLEAKDKLGRAALHLAVEERSEAVVQLLMDNGADLQAKDNNEHS